MSRSAVVILEDDRISCRGRDGRVESILWSDLQGVLIQTTAEGPFVDDAFFVLVGESSVCVVPSEADGAGELLARLRALRGFDHDACINAMTCTEERRFVCWTRP